MHLSRATASAQQGTDGGGGLSYKTALLVISFLAIAVFNAVDIFVKIFMTFKRYQGLYFWSLIVACIGIVLHAFGYFFYNYDVSKSLALEVFLVGVGSIMMVTGQSIVLYSRLHLISRSSTAKRDRLLLVMIFFDCVVGHVGATTLFAGSNSNSPDASKYNQKYYVWERMQVTLFFTQECIISGIYFWRTYVLVSREGDIRGSHSHKLLKHLIIVNLLVIALDVTILAFEYANLYDIQTAWKTLVYSIKLKAEFTILNRLVDLTKYGFNGESASRRNRSNAGGPDEGTAVQASVRRGNNTFGNSAYAKMEDEGVILPLKDLGSVMKKTEVEVKVEGIHDGSHSVAESAGTNGTGKGMRDSVGDAQEAFGTHVV